MSTVGLLGDKDRSKELDFVERSKLDAFIVDEFGGEIWRERSGAGRFEDGSMKIPAASKGIFC